MHAIYVGVDEPCPSWAKCKRPNNLSFSGRVIGGGSSSTASSRSLIVWTSNYFAYALVERNTPYKDPPQSRHNMFAWRPYCSEKNKVAWSRDKDAWKWTFCPRLPAFCSTVSCLAEMITGGLFAQDSPRSAPQWAAWQRWSRGRSGLLPEFGVWILDRSKSWSRSQYFRFKPEQEPESALRSVQEPIKIFQGPIKISVTMLVVVKQNGINSDMFSDQRHHISQ